MWRQMANFLDLGTFSPCNLFIIIWWKIISWLGQFSKRSTCATWGKVLGTWIGTISKTLNILWFPSTDWLASPTPRRASKNIIERATKWIDHSLWYRQRLQLRGQKLKCFWAIINILVLLWRKPGIKNIFISSLLRRKLNLKAKENIFAELQDCARLLKLHKEVSTMLISQWWRADLASASLCLKAEVIREGLSLHYHREMKWR